VNADFNGDGKPDVAVLNGSDDEGILLGNGVGGFGAPYNFRVANNPVGIAVSDVNLDGRPDLAISNYCDGSVSVFLNGQTLVYDVVCRCSTKRRQINVGVLCR
jgi:hypothetical protein